MMILTDFYLAFATLLIACAGILLVWQRGLRSPNKSLLIVAVALFALSGMIAVGCLVYYGGHLMSKGECPYTEPLVPCPTTPSGLVPQPSLSPTDPQHNNSTPQRLNQSAPANSITI